MGAEHLADDIRLPLALARWFSELTHHGLFVTDRELRLIVWNQWMESHAKRPASDVIGRSLLDLYPDLVARGLDQYYRNAQAGHISVVSYGLHRYIVPMPPSNWNLGLPKMPQSGRIDPLLDGAKVIGTVTSLEDISDRLAHESELRKQIEVQQRARVVAEDALRAKDDFLSTVSHEMRNPLNAVLGWARILIDRKDIDPAMLDRALRIIDRNAAAQGRMIDDLLDVARIASGKLRLEIQPVDLLAVARAAVEVVMPSARTKRIDIRTSLDPAVPRVLGDQQRLQQVVLNLLSNAVKFTDAGGVIDVRVESVGSMIRLTVRDTGHGISKEFLPFVFERFRQSDGSSARRHGGLGLGLALVRELVELHGGKVAAESAGENRGATFMIDLPTATSPEVRQNHVSDRGAVEDEPTSLAGIRVLIVDDEADSRELIGELLRTRGADVVSAASCEEALEVVASVERTRRPHVILSDLGMPKEDGFALIRKLQALECELDAHLPVIAVTGYANPDDRRRALAAGFHSHLAKPIEPSAIARAVLRAARDARL